MNPRHDASESLLLQAARSIDVPAQPEAGLIAWKLACRCVALEVDLERAVADIRELKAQLAERSYTEKPDWSAA